MDYKARFYGSTIDRFIQPDSIIPNPADPQGWNRLSYVRNNPLRFTDPTGHYIVEEEDCTQLSCSGDPMHKPKLKPDKDRNAEGESSQVVVPGGVMQAEAFFSIAPSSWWSAWQIPSHWDLVPSHPDYNSLVLSYGIFMLEFTEDRYGHRYIAGGLVFSASSVAGGASVYGGNVGSATDRNMPGEVSMGHFLTGLTVNGSGGFVGGAGGSFVPGVFAEWYEYQPGLFDYTNNSADTSAFSIETGMYTPQAGVSLTYGWQID